MTSGLLLAAGRGQRMGDFKPLIQVQGRTLLDRALGFLQALPLGEVVVVAGYRAQEILSRLPPGVRGVNHRGWSEGMGSSLREGVRALSPDSQAVLITLVDLPFLQPEVGLKLLQARGPIVLPVHQGRRGHPVLFGRALYQELLQLQGERGASVLFERHPVVQVSVDCPGIHHDLDRPEDLPGRGRTGQS